MPTPDRTSLPAIVAAGKHLLESHGLRAVTMQAVANRVGVRPPSLYKRVRNRDELIQLIAEAAASDLRGRLVSADPGGGAQARLRALAGALRSFAQARPAAYRLVFETGAESGELSRDVLEATSAPLFDAVSELTGPDHVLEAARTITAWATGFISMELNGQFHLGGNVDDAFDYGVARLTEAITAR